jgi:hypothetical protein
LLKKKKWTALKNQAIGGKGSRLPSNVPSLPLQTVNREIGT